MSVYQKADPGELIQWVTHESRSSAASNSGLIRIWTQPRTADAWHHDSCRPRGVVTRDFSAIFGHFWPSVWPCSRSNFDLGPSPLDSMEKKHIRAYDFGVQFSFKHINDFFLHHAAKISWSVQNRQVFDYNIGKIKSNTWTLRKDTFPSENCSVVWTWS